MPKQGSGFDLALAAAVLAASGAVPRAAVDRLVLLGRARPRRIGARRSAACCRRCSRPPGPVTAQVVVPAANADEAALVDSVEVLAVGDAGRAGRPSAPAGAGCRPHVARSAAAGRRRCPTCGDVVGQAAGRRAVEVAAAGGHHLFLTGPPGAGKTMLAERLPGLLPPLDEQAALEVTAIHSVAGTLPPGAPLVTPADLRGAAPLGHDGRR